MNTWYEINCPACEARNFFNNGDISDPTGFDIDNLKCYKCKCCWHIEDNFPDDIDPEECEEGVASP